MLFQPCSILAQGGLTNGTGSMALCSTVRRTVNIRKQGKFKLTSFTPPSCWKDQPSLFFPRQESCLRSPQRKSLLFSSHLTCAGEPPGAEERRSAPLCFPFSHPPLQALSYSTLVNPFSNPFLQASDGINTNSYYCSRVEELFVKMLVTELS